MGANIAVSSEGIFSLVGFSQSEDLASLDAAQPECQGKNDYIIASFSYDASISETVNSIPGYNSLILVASLTIFGFMTLKKKKY